MTSIIAAPDAIAFSSPARGLISQALRRFFRRPLAVAALSLLLLILAAGALAGFIEPQGWNMIDLAPGAVHSPPSLSHPFGTDPIGRDMLTRTLYGIRTSEEVALPAALLATLIGIALGAIAGFAGGWVDAIIMRLADLVTAYPAVILTLGAAIYLNQLKITTLIWIFSAYMWAVVARVVRAEVATLAMFEFADAARAIGASNTRVLVRHLLPNASGTILVAATSLVGQIVLIDATVEFFSYGLNQNVSPSLGNLIADVVQFKFGLSNDPIVANYGWWTWVFPGLVLMLILININFIGDALDTSFNPAAQRN